MRYFRRLKIALRKIKLDYREKLALKGLEKWYRNHGGFNNKK